jgi:hypothetical protein
MELTKRENRKPGMQPKQRKGIKIRGKIMKERKATKAKPTFVYPAETSKD